MFQIPTTRFKIDFESQIFNLVSEVSTPLYFILHFIHYSI